MADTAAGDDEDGLPRVIRCATHGETAPTFTCIHLATSGSTGLGVCYDATSSDPWPDLFCEVCNQEPEWSDEEAVSKIKLLCGHCWDETFESNTGVHHPNPEGWLADAMERAERRQRRWTDEFQIQGAARYRYELEQSPPWLGFGRTDTRFDVLCDPVVLGSWSGRSNTWLWGWANSWWAAPLTRPVVRVKRAGEKLGIERLYRSGFSGTEEMAWEVCLAALDLMPEFSGIYRSPNDNGSLFLAARNTRRTE